jgi:hypothetical protein
MKDPCCLLHVHPRGFTDEASIGGKEMRRGRMAAGVVRVCPRDDLGWVLALFLSVGHEYIVISPLRTSHESVMNRALLSFGCCSRR